MLTVSGKKENVLEYSARSEARWKAFMATITNYKPFTSFYLDLSIAEFMEGEDGVRKTYKSVVKHWLSDYKYFTEFSLCLNHKIWEHYKTCPNLAKTYDELWRDSQDKFYDRYEGDKEARIHYFKVTD